MLKISEKQLSIKDSMMNNTEAQPPSRRQFLIQSGLGLTAFAISDSLKAAPANSTSLVKSIESEVLFNGRTENHRWFHPRACVVPGTDHDSVLMTMQSITGSDVFGPVHWTESLDQGKSWTTPELIPGLGRREFDATHEVGVCDVTPQYHPQTQTTIAMGHNVYYRNQVLANPQLNRWPVYSIRNAEGAWSQPQKLHWDDPRGAFIYTCNCGQRLVLENGDILIALTFGADIKQPRLISTIRCTYDGSEIKVTESGNTLENSVKRGLLEPSLVAYGNRYYVTIRAEDDRGYVAVSDDGLNWEPQVPWCWEDGEPLVMSTTQQHWLEHSDALYLVYTRRDETNAKVIRYRAPIYMAEVNLETMQLNRETEQIVLPALGDPVNFPKGVALMGDFNITHLNQHESWVTVGENLPYAGYKGNTLLARIKWSRPNLLVQS
ncbi:MAG: sialidase family protein [Planctomycetaceae bacterium]